MTTMPDRIPELLRNSGGGGKPPPYIGAVQLFGKNF